MRLEGLISAFEEPLLIDGHLLIPVICTIEKLVTGSTLNYMILDLDGPGSGARAVHSILLIHPELRIIVIGPQANDDVALRAISAGARAYLDLTSDIATLRQALEVVVEGSIWGPHRLLSRLVDQLLNIGDSFLTTAHPQLTAREAQVAERILAARSNGQIARDLGIGAQTVTAHVGRIMRKTGTVNRIGLASFMRKNPSLVSEIELVGAP
jgi:DNA-binding NarL/FixJ family response regulator